METLRIGRPPQAPPRPVRRRAWRVIVREIGQGLALGLGAGLGITVWVMIASVW